jgi:hypothetical protein
VSIDTTVCVPPSRSGVEVRADGASSIPPNPRTIELRSGRGGGVQIYLSGQIGRTADGRVTDRTADPWVSTRIGGLSVWASVSTH